MKCLCCGKIISNSASDVEKNGPGIESVYRVFFIQKKCQYWILQKSSWKNWQMKL